MMLHPWDRVGPHVATRTYWVESVKLVDGDFPSRAVVRLGDPIDSGHFTFMIDVTDAGDYIVGRMVEIALFAPVPKGTP